MVCAGENRHTDNLMVVNSFSAPIFPPNTTCLLRHTSPILSLLHSLGSILPSLNIYATVSVRDYLGWWQAFNFWDKAPSSQSLASNSPPLPVLLRNQKRGMRRTIWPRVIYGFSFETSQLQTLAMYCHQIAERETTAISQKYLIEDISLPFQREGENEITFRVGKKQGRKYCERCGFNSFFFHLLPSGVWTPYPPLQVDSLSRVLRLLLPYLNQSINDLTLRFCRLRQVLHPASSVGRL